MTTPIDIVIHCPMCGLQHIDAPFKPGDTYDIHCPEKVLAAAWTNPPHRTHLCDGCGHLWRPADVPTNGVAAVKTKGENDSPIAKPLGADEFIFRLGENREISYSQWFRNGTVQLTIKRKT